MKITQRGRKLANILAPYIGVSLGIPGICSSLCRLESQHKTLAEQECNGPTGEWTQEWADKLERRIERLERSISELVALLPATEHGPVGVEFSGDPRGATVKLILPVACGFSNCWGGEGRVCLP